MITLRALIALMCVALAIGAISLFMGIYTRRGATDCRVPKTIHSASYADRTAVRWVGMDR
jgi:hypothetical protein